MYYYEKKVKQWWSIIPPISIKQRKFKQWWSIIPPISIKQRNFKQWWSIIPPISIKRTSIFSACIHFCNIRITELHYFIQSRLPMLSRARIRRVWRYQRGLISESINWRRTDTTMAKRKRTQGQTTIYKILHRKQKIIE